MTTGIVAQFKDRPAVARFLRRWFVPIAFILFTVFDVATDRISWSTYAFPIMAIVFIVLGLRSDRPKI